MSEPNAANISFHSAGESRGKGENVTMGGMDEPHGWSAASPSPPESETDRYRNALIEVHEYQCGCALLDPAECVCSPPVVFEALRD